MAHASSTSRWFWPDLRAVAEIQRMTVKQRKRCAVCQLFHARNDKETIATWRTNLNRILYVFNVSFIVLCAAIINHPSQD